MSVRSQAGRLTGVVGIADLGGVPGFGEALSVAAPPASAYRTL